MRTYKTDRVLDDEIKYWSKDETYAPISLSPNKAAVDINISQISEMVLVLGPDDVHTFTAVRDRADSLLGQDCVQKAERAFNIVILCNKSPTS